MVVPFANSGDLKLMRPRMRAGPAFHRSSLIAAACVCAAVWTAGLTASGEAATAVRLSLDRGIDGAAAPFILAQDKGFYRQQNLDVTTSAAKGSPRFSKTHATMACAAAFEGLTSSSRRKSASASTGDLARR